MENKDKLMWGFVLVVIVLVVGFGSFMLGSQNQATGNTTGNNDQSFSIFNPSTWTSPSTTTSQDSNTNPDTTDNTEQQEQDQQQQDQEEQNNQTENGVVHVDDDIFNFAYEVNPDEGNDIEYVGVQSS